MAKKPKVELTLEELQAKKSKNQRGWVRFCAILLAVVLTAGIFGLASNGDPKVVDVYPNVVRAQTKTVVQKQDPTPTDPDTSEDEDNPTTTPSGTEEEGGLLDKLLGLLGGIDLGALIGNLDFEGLGITIASGIQTAKDSLLNIIDQLEAAISGKPVISHDPVEYDFAADMDRGDEAARNILVDAINRATAKEFGYTVNHMADYTSDGHVSIGEQTETVNQILGAVGITLDDVIGEFVGRQTSNGEAFPLTYMVEKGQTAEEAVAAIEGMHASAANYGLMPTQLTADDIAIVDKDTNPLNGTYTFRVKNVDNPNRRADCGLTRLTNDYLVQPEVAERIKNAGGLTEVSVSPLKLTDLITSYSDIQVTAQLDALGNLKSMTVSYTVFSKFTVRTNTVQVIGASTMEISDTYSDFVY